MILALLATMTVASAAYPDPLAPAADGKVQCYTPDAARKTCRSISAYVANGDGTFNNTATILLSPQPVLVLETTTPVTIKASAVCGSLTPANMAAAKLTADGKVLSPEEAQPVLAQITAAMQSFFNKEICTTYTASGTDLVAKATIDGAPMGPDQPVQWIGKDDGYKVAP